MRKSIRIDEQFKVTCQFGFNDLDSFYGFCEWLNENDFVYSIDRITACFQIEISVDDFMDAAKIQTQIQTP